MHTLPAGPRFPALQAFKLARDTKQFFLDTVGRYGDPFKLALPMGDVVVTGDPEGIREIFTADPSLFTPFANLPLEPVVGRHSVLLLDGARHRRERKLLTPPFHGDRMRAYGDLMATITLRKAAELSAGAKFKAQDLTQEISLEVIIEAVFGVRDPARVALFREAIVGYIEAYTPPLMMITPLRRSFGGLGPWARFQRYTERFHALIAEEIEARRKSGEVREDILSLLLSVRDEEGRPMSDEEIDDELRTMLIAGHETTAIGMAWALDGIHRNSRIRDRLLAEIRELGPAPAPEALIKLPYLSAVCDEALRLHPVVAMVSRKLLAPFTFRGRELPPGVAVMAAIVLVHHNPALYPDADVFRPERFLERKFTPFEYLPFGGGARRCLGAAFALYEMKIVLGTLLSEHRFQVLSAEPPRVVRRNVTLGPSEGAPLRYLGPVQRAVA
ncbi:cytochrome P450 [Polyangium sp. y55x31]|uniref:cytochrome P450 n=1 Tax=Polyangium sp. y55x31 TaxID=3042688 RepID=UPI00248306BF|nr:cytochrome P450 [Polyangium sp. y55x31]MDI1475329.1 cytochrome P450 [Polyangium sp. y55x31]